MARVAKVDPDAELEALHRKRVERAMRRNGLENAVPAHRVQMNGAIEVEGIADREAAVRLALARGETPSETLEEVERDRQAAVATIDETRKQCEAFRTAEKEIEEEVDAVIDAHPEHFLQAAVAASEATSEAIAAAVNATQAAVTVWMGTRAAWGRVRLSRRRCGLDLGPEVPVSDLGQSVNELSKAQPQPWPGGSKGAWERWCEHEAGPKVKVSNREAIAAFGGEAA
jgi:hypothetical protein